MAPALGAPPILYKKVIMRSATTYQITILEKLDDQWAEWFLPLVIRNGPNGNTMLCGPIRDQGELHGVLAKVRDLNLTLVEVNRVGPAPNAA
jgi:hypothetical protein